MATFQVDELFPGATVAGMRAVPASSRIIGRFAYGQGLRGVTISETPGDGGDSYSVLECEVRKGVGRGARIGVLRATLAEAPDGVRAKGTFGPGLMGGLGCMIRVAALAAMGLCLYNLVRWDHPVYNGIALVLMVLVLRYAGAVVRFLVPDHWNSEDLSALLQSLHQMYDGASASTAVGEHGEESEA